MAGPGFSTPGTYTPLQLIAGSGLLQNQGISVPGALTSAVSSYNSLDFVENLNNAIAAAPAYGISASVITSLKTLASNTCPALGSSVPAAYAGDNTLLPTSVTGGFGNLVANNAALYLGNGSVDKFCQTFQLISGYRATTNELVCSAVNATTYLGPTFTSMNDLITGQLTGVNLAMKCFGSDLAKTGNLINLDKLPTFGTPANILEQISEMAGITSGTLSCVAKALAEYGLTENDIILLCTPGASNDGKITDGEFNALQKIAYAAMTSITGSCLEYVLQILDADGLLGPVAAAVAGGIPGTGQANTPVPLVGGVPGGIPTTGQVNTLADLVDLKKIFPTSWTSMTTPVTTAVPGIPAATILLYNTDGSVNPALESALSNNPSIILPSGCDDLAKIIPPGQAVVNKAFQAALQQVGGINTVTAPRLSIALLG
jgi:hypothetical protein